MRNVTVAAVQMACTWDVQANIQKAETYVRQAAKAGAQIILLQELFECVYFCQQERPEFIAFAVEEAQDAAVNHFQHIAKELGVVLPISFYERHNRAHYNAIAVIDADGTILGTYRKTHIPDGPGYEEKYYFNPGDTGFKVWRTKYATIGVGICWDQWFPESARCMALLGAELLFYPTAIGSEPEDATIDSRDHWQRCMQGHAAANLMPVIAANRTGQEVVGDSKITFYGSSFITDGYGAKVEEASRTAETVITHQFDLDALEAARAAWGVFRDRRPEMYGPLLTLDGEQPRLKGR